VPRLLLADTGVVSQGWIPPGSVEGPPRGQNDGVVKYESEYLDEAASEKLVRSYHSTQSTPTTILEVRRILSEHLRVACGLECGVLERVDAAAASYAQAGARGHHGGGESATLRVHGQHRHIHLEGGKEMTRMTGRITRAGAAAGVLLFASGAAWGQTFVYPQKGQTPQRQAQDQAECQAWATQQTGVNPGMPAPGPAPAAAPTSSPLRGATRGAAVGAVGGAIGGDAGKGAAIGAATGAMVGGMRRRDQVQQQQAQQAQAQQMQAQQMDTFGRAQATCLQARGYSVN